MLQHLEITAAGNHQVAEENLGALAKTTGSYESAKEFRNELLAESRGLRYLSRHAIGRRDELHKQLNPDTDHERIDIDRSGEPIGSE